MIEDPAAAAVALEPIRARLQAELAEPRSAAMLASRVGLSRQKVNYHLRALERHGLVREANIAADRGSASSASRRARIGSSATAAAAGSSITSTSVTHRANH